jgi:hypothetical protein
MISLIRIKSMKDLLTLVIPLAGMLLTTYLMLQHFHNKSIEQNDSKIKSDKNNKFFPLQIQAYERIILFLERIDPSNMLIRTHKSGMTIESLHMALLKIIREEYTHNMSQQVFIDPNSWQILLNAKDETVQLINVAKNSLQSTSSSLDYSAKIFELIASKNISSAQSARNKIVKEFQESLKSNS